MMAVAALVVAFAPIPLSSARHPAERVFRIEARQFSYLPSEISVNLGDTVTLQLVSMDVVHGLYVDGYGVSVEADPGQTASLTFTADKTGSFRMRCSVTCGALHPFMIGKLTVGTNAALYRAIGLALIGLVGISLFPKPPLPENLTS
jgi:heme/copper-type cytochrome/quinol oxidase subunit 2